MRIRFLVGLAVHWDSGSDRRQQRVLYCHHRDKAATLDQVGRSFIQMRQSAATMR